MVAVGPQLYSHIGALSTADLLVLQTGDLSIGACKYCQTVAFSIANLLVLTDR